MEIDETAHGRVLTGISQRVSSEAQKLQQFALASLRDPQRLTDDVRGALELLTYHLVKHCFELIALQSAGNAECPQPLVAFAQQVREQILDVLAAMIAPVEQAVQIIGQFVAAIHTVRAPVALPAGTARGCCPQAPAPARVRWRPAWCGPDSG